MDTIVMDKIIEYVYKWERFSNKFYDINNIKIISFATIMPGRRVKINYSAERISTIDSTWKKLLNTHVEISYEEFISIQRDAKISSILYD